MSRIIIAHLGIVVLLAAVAACAPTPPRTPEQETVLPPGFLRAGARVYTLDPASSTVRILVYRGGTLAGLGHNHVLALEAFDGAVYLHDALEESGFELRFALTGMVLDRPADRRTEGADFDSSLSPADIAATRDNMLGEDGLDAANFPEVEMHSLSVAGALPDPDVEVQITLHGRVHRYTIPVRLEIDGGRLRAAGGFLLRQTDFGITPFSAVLGALRVQDEIRVRFELAGLLTADD